MCDRWMDVKLKMSSSSVDPTLKLFGIWMKYLLMNKQMLLLNLSKIFS